jgi:hypothetical protein
MIEKIADFIPGMYVKDVIDILKKKLNEIIEIENLEKIKFDKNNSYNPKPVETLRIIINEIIDKRHSEK